MLPCTTQQKKVAPTGLEVLVALRCRGRDDITFEGSVAVRHSIAHAILACLRNLLSYLLPATGKHRVQHPESVPASAVSAGDPETMTLRRVAANPHMAPWGSRSLRSPYSAANAAKIPLRGEDLPAVPGYYRAWEREREEYRRVTAERRRAAALATLGVDVGPDVIHGVRLPV